MRLWWAASRPALPRLQVGVAVTLGVSFDTYTAENLPKGIALLALIFVCIYVAAFAWWVFCLRAWLSGHSVTPPVG